MCQYDLERNNVNARLKSIYIVLNLLMWLYIVEIYM